MKGEAKQIVVFDEKKQLKLDKVELDKILNQEHIKGLPIVILSVIGAFRTGKSFLLSWLVCYFQSKTPDCWLEQYKQEEASLSHFFKWRSGSKAETQGIWAWSEVFIVNGPVAGEEVGVLLIDTQGLFDENNTSKQNGNIFTLSTLISSIQIFNLSQKMQENYLENLQLFSEFGRRAQLLTQQNSNSITNNKPFQRMVFLIRDWQYQAEHPYGSEGGQRYIDSYLDITNKGIEQGELNERRKHVRECISQVQCYLMPHPGKKVANGEGNYDGRLSDMEEIFQDHLKELPNFLFHYGAVEPKTVAGTPILAGDVSGHVELYVDLLNSNENLSPQSMFQAMAKIHNNTVARNANKEYKAYVTAIEKELIDTFLTDIEIKKKHSEAKKKALDYFAKEKMEEEESNSTILNELKKDIKGEFENWKKRNEGTKAEILNVNETATKEAENMYSTSIDDWLKNITPFATMEQLAKQHKEIQETTTNDFNSRLKGPDELKMPFTIRLHKFMENYFFTVVVPKNESKEREEKDRLEKIRLEKELEKERLEKEEAQRKATEAESRLKMEAVAKAAREEYKTFVTSVEGITETFMTNAEIESNHAEAQKLALDYFEKHSEKHRIGDSMFIAAILNELKNDFKNELTNWKSRNDRAKGDTTLLNEKELNNAKEAYSTSIDDWLEGIHPNATSEQTNEHHLKIQETTENDLKSRLKGPNDFTNTFTDRFIKLTQDYFENVIVPKNESKEREEKQRLERIRLETERENERLKKEEAQRQAEEAESRRMAAVMEAELKAEEAAAQQKEKEDEIYNIDVLARNSKKEYKNFVTKVEDETENFLTEIEIETKHAEAKEKALDYFEIHRKGDSISYFAIMDKLKKDFDDEFENWKRRNDLAKSKIVILNGEALKEAEMKYFSFMEGCLSERTTISREAITEHHREMQETTKENLISELKGPNEFTTPFTTRFIDSTEEYFQNEIIPKNDRNNQRDERARSELAEARDKQHRAEEEARTFNKIKTITLGVATAAGACVAGVAIVVESPIILAVGATAAVASGIGSFVNSIGNRMRRNNRHQNQTNE